MTMTRCLLLVCLGWFMSVVPCDLAKAASGRGDTISADVMWSWAQHKDTAQAYRCFAFYHPGDSRAATAVEKWRAADIESARNQHTRSAYQRLFSRHPEATNTVEIPPRYATPWQRSSWVPGATPEETTAAEILAAHIEGKTWRVVDRSLAALCVGGYPQGYEVLGQDPADIRNSEELNRVLARLATPETIELLMAWIEAKPLSGMASSQFGPAEALAEIGDRNVVEEFIQALNDPAPATRQQACRVLARLVYPETAAALGKALNDQDDLVRKSALQALVAVGSRPAADAIIEALEKSGNLSLRELSDLGDFRALPFLVAEVRQKTNDVSSWSTIEALGKLQDPHAVKDLGALLKHEHPGYAIKALAAIGSEEAADVLLKRLLSDNLDYGMKADLVQALGRIGYPKAIKPINKLLDKEDLKFPATKENHGRDRFYMYAIAALCELGDTKAMPRFNSTMAELTSLATVGELKQVGNATARFTLAPGRLNELYDEFRSAITEVTSPRAVDALIAGLDKAAPRVKLDLCQMLGRVGDARVVPILVKVLKEDYDTKSSWHPPATEAAVALGAIGDTAAVPALIEACKSHEHPYVQFRSAQALAAIGSPLAFDVISDYLQRMLKEQHVEQNVEACFVSFGKMGDPRGISMIMDAFRAKEWPRQKEAAAVAISRMADAGGVEHVSPFLADPHASVRELAAAALDELARSHVMAWMDLPGDGLPAGLDAALKDEEEGVRIAAAQAVLWWSAGVRLNEPNYMAPLPNNENR